jgi:hypothetical protein
MLDDLITPEGQAFSDYVESINSNPYPHETNDHARYKAAMAEMEGES